MDHMRSMCSHMAGKCLLTRRLPLALLKYKFGVFVCRLLCECEGCSTHITQLLCSRPNGMCIHPSVHLSVFEQRVMACGGLQGVCWHFIIHVTAVAVENIFTPPSQKKQIFMTFLCSLPTVSESESHYFVVLTKRV